MVGSKKFPTFVSNNKDNEVMNKEKIINSICVACRETQGGTLKFGTGGFVDFSVSWDYRCNFDIFNLKTKEHHFCSTLGTAVEIVEKLLTEI